MKEWPEVARRGLTPVNSDGNHGFLYSSLKELDHGIVAVVEVMSLQNIHLIARRKSN